MTCVCHIRAEGVSGIIAVKLTGTISKHHPLELTMPPSGPPGEVEVIVLHPEAPLRSRVRGRLHRTEDISRTALAWFERFHLSHGVGVLDRLIGATVFAHHLTLATLNPKPVVSCPGLRTERPY